MQSKSFANWDISYIDKSFPQQIDVLTVHAADDLVRSFPSAPPRRRSLLTCYSPLPVMRWSPSMVQTLFSFDFSYPLLLC